MIHRHFLIYKPFKMVSQFITNDKHQKKKRFLGELHDFPEQSMAIGRLDETSEGLLLITTDGRLSNNINKSSHFEKEYYVQVDGVITDQAVSRLKNGIEISVNGKAYLTNKCIVNKLIDTPDLPETVQRIRDERHGPSSWISIVLNEGKFRQVRKMTSAVGFPTLRLVRVRIGPYEIKEMKSGDVIEISDMDLRETIS